MYISAERDAADRAKENLKPTAFSLLGAKTVGVSGHSSSDITGSRLEVRYFSHFSLFGNFLGINNTTLFT